MEGRDTDLDALVRRRRGHRGGFSAGSMSSELRVQKSREVMSTRTGLSIVRTQQNNTYNSASEMSQPNGKSTRSEAQ